MKGKIYLLGFELVTMETFVDQRSRSAPPRMVYIILRTHMTNRNGSQLNACAMCYYNSDERVDKQLA